MSDLKSYVSRIERLDDEIADLNADKATVYKDAKLDGFDLPALRLVIGERRKRAKNAAAFSTLQGIAETYRLELEGGTKHALRAHAHEEPQTARAGIDGGAVLGGSGRVAPAAPPDAIPPSSAVVASIPEPLPRSDVEASPPAALDTPHKPDDGDGGIGQADPLATPAFLRVGTEANRAARGGR